MDTIENNAGPVGEAGATVSPDTLAEVDTQTVAPEAAVSDGGSDQAPEASEPLLAGKYKSPEELENAYKELEGKLGSLGQKAAVADLIQEKYGMTPEQLRQTIEAEEQARLDQELQTNPAGFALREVQTLKQQLALKEVESELDAYLRENPESAANRDKILKLALGDERDKSFADIDREWFGATRAQGQQDAYKKIEVKQKTQATGTTSVPKRQFSADDFKNMSVAEMEALLPHADVSDRPVR